MVSPMKRLLDSVILIDHFNGIQAATDFVMKLDPSRTAISVITRAEILVGLDEGSHEDAGALLDQYVLLIIDKIIADEAAALRRKYGWRFPDAFQAALAVHHGLKLVTRNAKDLDPRKHAFVEIPYKI
jgi:predicted nucleic acid-binding protein